MQNLVVEELQQIMSGSIPVRHEEEPETNMDLDTPSLQGERGEHQLHQHEPMAVTCSVWSGDGVRNVFFLAHTRALNSRRQTTTAYPSMVPDCVYPFRGTSYQLIT